MSESQKEIKETKEEVSPAEALKKAAQEAVYAEKKENETSEIQKEPSEEVDESVFQQLQEAQDKAAEHYELYVRAAAELENTRRRCEEDVRKARLFGIESFAKNLLPVLDSFEKALEATKDADPAIKDGLTITYKQLSHALEVSGMVCVDPVGEPFNPEVAQAIVMVSSDDQHATGTVVTVLQKGWKLNERILRPAMVSVAK